ncbi:MAG: zinc-binding dehydrogenase [Actinobacteria bacterium]|nr:MAG: zinc-binding dehydrogenase [Actinomycetota bacterium]
MSRRALVVERPGEIALVERPDLEPGPDEAVLRPAFCGVCGTDLELLRGDVDPAYVRYPVTLGHEWSGVVEGVGPGVENVAVGDRCVVEGIVPCGRCASCRTGATNTCDVYDEIGFTREGGASDQVLVPARLVHILAPEVTLDNAALVEPASVVLRALEKAGPPEGGRVVVLGDGTIALLAVQLIGLWSPAEVVVVGRRADQAELALRAGATRFTLEDGEAAGADLVIEAAGAVEAVGTAVRAAKRGGTVLLIGLPPTGRTVELAADLLVNNDLTLAASFSYTAAAWGRVVDLLNSGRISPGSIVTHRFPLDAHEQAFAELSAPTGPRGKILLEISPEEAYADG